MVNGNVPQSSYHRDHFLSLRYYIVKLPISEEFKSKIWKRPLSEKQCATPDECDPVAARLVGDIWQTVKKVPSKSQGHTQALGDLKRIV